MRNLRFAAAFTVLFLISIPRSARAQDLDENEGGKDDKSCEKAAKIVSKGHPEKKEAWALGRLSFCGKLGADALVSAIPQQMGVTDTLVLDSFFTTVDNWRDGAVMTAGLDLARNPSASARLQYSIPRDSREKECPVPVRRHQCRSNDVDVYDRRRDDFHPAGSGGPRVRLVQHRCNTTAPELRVDH